MIAIWDKAPLRMFFILPILSRLIASNDVLDYKPIGHSQYVENYEAKSERKRCKRYLGIYFVLIALAVVMGPELKSVVPSSIYRDFAGRRQRSLRQVAAWRYEW
mgnify:CR=1 FL=1